jgi:Flp pilus assembly protein TadD
MERGHWKTGASLRVVEESAVLLRQALLAIQRGHFDEADQMLAETGRGAWTDAVRWNLQGVAFECRREWKRALRCYGRAVRADRQFAPARQNLRRLYELYTFGRSNEPIALGEEQPCAELCTDNGERKWLT